MQQYKNIKTGDIPTVSQNSQNVILNVAGAAIARLVRIEEQGETIYMTNEDFDKNYSLIVTEEAS